ncbi:Two-component system, sensor histidine kinase [Romboutsia ilealis]|uniref:histidine kinase n=1 Tax=Romboutsia ilealis TaxID=1115758 RepID=A0A1V1I1R9_9FIRM|nr:sensor histidine kinase [Romboutsia ilealis]CED94181.1 Two-component system, sensor histidine kinase [Romboutsia ilealis]
MKENKKLKFAFLITAMISLSLIVALIPAFNFIINNSRGVMTSYMHEDKKLIEDDFYKSKAFDEALIRPLLYWTSTSIMDENDNRNYEFKEHYEKAKDSAKKQLSYIKNMKYIAINKDTNEVYSNTNYKSIEDFKKNIKGECDVDLSSNNDVISYTKQIKDEIFKKVNVNKELRDVLTYNLYDFEVCISINQNFENYGYYDKVSEIKNDFDNEVIYFKIIIVSAIISLILFIISIVIYKKMKCEVLDRNSFYLKLYKIIPLEIYFLLDICLLCILLETIETGYYGYYYGSLEHLAYTFIWIFGLLAIAYILRKEIKSFDKPIEILKTSLIVRLLILGKKQLKDINKVTKSIPLAKRVIILAALSVGVGTIGWFIGFLFGSTLLLFLFGPILSLTIVVLYVYYLIKKLSYLSYIMEGTERIKGGDIHYKLDIIGDDNFSNLAENINNIGEGLDKAIYNQLKSERLKSELITNVSHDLKTPLTSIINYIELIKKEEDIKPEHIKDYVNVLDSKSKRLKVLIEDLFEASKASSGNLELNMEKIDITQLLRQAIGEMEEKLSNANLDLKLRVPEEKTYIMADGKKLYRVLENLLSNISKYSLNNTRVYIDIIEEDDKVKLTMKNISSYELNFDPEEIMERFKRSDESRNTEGSGLGLAIARDLVNAQGGRFEIDIDGDLFKSVVEFNLID